MGEDIAAVQVSYRQLIRLHFQDQRDRVTGFLEQRWKPAYLQEFIARGELVQMASGKDPVEAFEGVSDWVDIAMDEISAKRDSLLKPIQQQEDTLLAATDAAFAQLMRSNAAITAHLSSVRHVEMEQDRALQAAHLKAVRDRLDAGLAAASERTQSALDELDRDRKRLEGTLPKQRTRH